MFWWWLVESGWTQSSAFSQLSFFLEWLNQADIGFHLLTFCSNLELMQPASWVGLLISWVDCASSKALFLLFWTTSTFSELFATYSFCNFFWTTWITFRLRLCNSLFTLTLQLTFATISDQFGSPLWLSVFPWFELDASLSRCKLIDWFWC